MFPLIRKEHLSRLLLLVIGQYVGHGNLPIIFVAPKMQETTSAQAIITLKTVKNQLFQEKFR